MYRRIKVDKITDKETCPLSYDPQRLRRLIFEQIYHPSNGLKRELHLHIPEDINIEEEITYLSSFFDMIMAPYLESQNPSINDEPELLCKKEVNRLRGAYLLRYLEGESIRDLAEEADARRIPGRYLHDSLKKIVTDATRSFASNE